jgi:hypothetical protein
MHRSLAKARISCRLPGRHRSIIHAPFQRQRDGGRPPLLV